MHPPGLAHARTTLLTLETCRTARASCPASARGRCPVPYVPRPEALNRTPPPQGEHFAGWARCRAVAEIKNAVLCRRRNLFATLGAVYGGDGVRTCSAARGDDDSQVKHQRGGFGCLHGANSASSRREYKDRSFFSVPDTNSAAPSPLPRQSTPCVGVVSYIQSSHTLHIFTSSHLTSSHLHIPQLNRQAASKLGGNTHKHICNVFIPSINATYNRVTRPPTQLKIPQLPH